MTTPTLPATVSAVADALGALDVHPPAGHSWMGRTEDLPDLVVRLADEEGARRALVGGIRARLYDSFFTTGRPRPATAARRRPSGRERALSGDLTAANEGAGWLQPGWRVVAEEDGRWVVQRAGLRLWVTGDDIAPGARHPGLADVVAIRRSTDLPALSPGFYMARGDRGFAADGSPVLDRVYLDLRREGAVPFVRETTRRLNRAGLPFIAKVVDEPDGFDRRDAGVLFFERRDRERALDAVDELAGALAPYLGRGAPAMTLPLSPGVAFAEDPGGAESFGSFRCRLIAEAAVAAAERGLESLDDRLDLVRERFAEAGTTLEAPHLGPPADGVPGPAAPPGGWVRG